MARWYGGVAVRRRATVEKSRHAPMPCFDTPPGLKPHGCSDERADEMTASIAAAYGLKALPGPTGRGMHGQASVTSKATRLVAHGTLSKVRSCLYRPHGRTEKLDTPPGLKPHGCADERAAAMTAASAAADVLKALPGPVSDGAGMAGRV